MHSRLLYSCLHESLRTPHSQHEQALRSTHFSSQRSLKSKKDTSIIMVTTLSCCQSHRKGHSRGRQATLGKPASPRRVPHPGGLATVQGWPFNLATHKYGEGSG